MATISTPVAPRLLRSFSPAEQSKLNAPSVWRERLPMLAIIAIALTLAVVQYRQYLDVHRQLWYDGTHDRNAHYLFALKLADDVRGGHLLQWFDDVNSARVWTPFQDLLGSFALIAAGFDDRLVIWPSVVGWALSIVFGFLVARRLVPSGGNLAGTVAALFIALSPAHRAYATDVMLESLGAGLSLAVLYTYLAAVQGDERAGAGRWLGLALTCLFLHKYNYWLLVFLAVLAAETLFWRRELRQAGRARLDTIDWRRLLRSQLLTVSNYVLLVLLVAAVAVWMHGDQPLSWRGRSIGIYPPFNLLQIAYWIAFVRVILWWQSAGRAWINDQDVRLRQVVRWHLWPAAWWLALPKHVGPFLWFLSPANADTASTSSLRMGLSDYAGWALTEYHVSLAAALIAAGLLVPALLGARVLRRGGLAVLFLLLLGTFLAADHPNRKARFAVSWIPAGWVCAGAGAAILVYGRLTTRIPRVRPWLACAALGGLGFAHFANGVPPAHAQEGGPRGELPSLLDVTDSYLPDLAGKQSVTVLSAVGIGFMREWTIIERFGQLDRYEDRRFGFGPPGEPNRQAFRDWLHNTQVETIVYIEALPGPRVETAWAELSELQYHTELRDLLDEQQVFRLKRRQEFPRHGCAVLVWLRRE